jgi:hypothetical protein
MKRSLISNNSSLNPMIEPRWIHKLEDPVCEKERNDLLRMFEFLDPSGQFLAKLKNLGKEDQQTHAYNEFAIGYLLKKNGYTLEYERKLEIEGSEKTPDWYVRTSNENPEFIVEVFTTSSDSSGARQKEERQVKILERRLQEIKFDGIIEIKVDRSSLDSSKIKQIQERIKSVLSQNSPILGFSYQLDDLNLEYKLLKRNVGGKNLRVVVSPSSAIKFDPKRFFDKISEKVKKYKRYSSPLVVAPFVDAVTIMAVLKSPQVIIDYFKKPPSLSAILWVDRCHPSVDGWEVNIVYNHNSNSRLGRIFDNEEYIEESHDFLCSRVRPKQKLDSSPQYESVKAGMKQVEFSLLLENAQVQPHYYWTTPIDYRRELTTLI